MEAPPPYRQKKSNTGLIIGLIIGGVVICCGGPVLLLGGGIIWGLNTFGPLATCGLAIDDIQTALHDYANDHGGKLPAAATWQDDVKSYYIKASQKKKNKQGNPF